MVPVIALVGRPNVGKSTLFNRLTKSRDAIVAEYAGLTRNRQYGEAKWQGRTYIVIDTGGISGDEEGIDAKMAEQSLQAIEEADAVRRGRRRFRPRAGEAGGRIVAAGTPQQVARASASRTAPFLARELAGTG